MGTAARWGLGAGLIGAGTSVLLAIGLSAAPVVPLTTGVVAATPPAAITTPSAPTIYEPPVQAPSPAEQPAVVPAPVPAPEPVSQASAPATTAPAEGAPASGSASSGGDSSSSQPQPAIGAPAGSRYGPTGYPTPSTS